MAVDLRRLIARRGVSLAGVVTTAALLSALLGSGPRIAEPPALAPAAVSPQTAAPAADKWTASWSASPHLSERTVGDTTLRMVVRTSTGGNQVRIRLTNHYGRKPLEIGAASIGLQAEGAAIVPETLRTLTFGGSASVTIPEGAETVSDAVALDVPALTWVTVSLYVPIDSLASEHTNADHVSYWSEAGEHVGDTDGTAYPTSESVWMFLNGVEVSRERGATVVAFGDSITDGGSTPDARYPSLLAERLQAKPKYQRFGVVNAGIGGNELLRKPAGYAFSEAGLTRMDRDVFLQTGVQNVLVKLGTNDILGLHSATGEELIAGLQQFVAKAHAQGVAVMGGTIIPCVCYNDAKNAEREEVNAWIRTTDVLDSYVDFDAVIRDPVDPSKIKPEYDSGDGLHPDAAGYDAMADAIDLAELTRHL